MFKSFTKRYFLTFLFLVSALSSSAAYSQAQDNQQTFISSDKLVSLLELYTSEGCSSCPPADRWLTTLNNDDKLWSEFVPVAFHVDYWDYIGWIDRFADQRYSQRQRDYASQYNENTVYTPGVRKDGKLWRSWRFNATPQREDNDRVGVLTLHLDKQANTTEQQAFSANYHPVDTHTVKDLTLTVALLGMGLNSKIQRGENKGKQLNHDFVVLDLVQVQSQNGQWRGQLPKSEIKAPSYAVAAWLSEPNSLKPIQAVGGVIK